jgi:hypothetical protein
LLFGCVNDRGSEFDLTSSDPSKDQAQFYYQEAMRFRQMADDLSHRALMYERLFGPKSDWVEGTRLLAQFYEDAAIEQERMAARHLEAVPGRQEDLPLLDRSLRRSGP